MDAIVIVFLGFSTFPGGFCVLAVWLHLTHLVFIKLLGLIIQLPKNILQLLIDSWNVATRFASVLEWACNGIYMNVVLNKSSQEPPFRKSFACFRGPIGVTFSKIENSYQESNIWNQTNSVTNSTINLLSIRMNVEATKMPLWYVASFPLEHCLCFHFSRGDK